MVRYSHLSALIISLVLIIGCSNPSGPVIPPDASAGITRAVDASAGSNMLWGYWQCELSTEDLEINAIPSRGVLTHINAVGPLNSSMGMSVTIDDGLSNPAKGYFVLTVALTHPYAGNAKLAGFDVHGIMITTAGESAGQMNLPGDNDPYMVNPDGYTRWWNPVEFITPGLLGYTPGIYGKDPPPGQTLVSSINPYKQFADGLYFSHDINFLKLILPTSPNGRGVFRSGAANSRQYEIQFPLNPGPKVFFNYAVDASWAPPSKDNPAIPNDFPLQANGAEPFIVDASVTGNTLWSAGGPQGGGELELEIEIWDWQGWLDGYENQVGALKLISPGIVFEEGIIPDVAPTGTGGAILTATVQGLASKTGTIPVWVGVTVPDSTYVQGASPAPSDPIAAFDLIEVEVAQAECQPNTSNDCTSAFNIGPVDSADGLLCLDVDDTDWYKFSVLSGGNAQGTIGLTSYNTGDLNLFLYSGCPPSLLDYSSIIGNSDELIEASGLVMGDYYIQVIEADNGDNSPRPYTLSTNLSGMGEDCTEDNNNTFDTADPTTISSTESGSVCAIGDPVDWYTFAISAGASGYGTIDLDNENFANNDIAVYDESLINPIFIGNNPGSSSEHLDVNLGFGTYYIRIDAIDVAPLGDRPYSLILNIEEFIGDCDNADGNNIPVDAESVEFMDQKSGTVCNPIDPDWYTIDISSNGAEGTIIASSLMTYDNDLAIYLDPQSSPVYESATPGNSDEVINVNLSGGTWYIKVTASPDTSSVNQAYALKTNLVEPEANPTDIYLHVHIVRANDGSSPAASEAKVLSDVAWANQFWGMWVDGGVIIDQITYIDRTTWLSCTTNEAEDMFSEYGSMDGALNVFYVNDFPDMPGAAAYAYMDCQFVLQDHTFGFINMSDYGDSATLAHEAFHAAGMQGDLYLLDWFNCSDVTYCPTGPTDIYCDTADAIDGNIMYWPIGSNINDYFMSNSDLYNGTPQIQSQGETVMYFHMNYPDAFFKP